ncbi:MAG: phosphopantothenoylcysteine decarboxylase [Verrucomicrobiota bacterium]
MKFLITAGPTREPIDPVRFLSNRSSGRMGYALAGAAAEEGHRVHLISGPVSLATPEGVDREDVTTAADMYEATAGAALRADVIIMTAAVADYRPVTAPTEKIKKSSATMTLELERTRDILGSLRDPIGFTGFLVGFAAETQNVEVYAREKLQRKGCDLLVANDVSQPGIGFDSTENEVCLYFKSGPDQPLPRGPKTDLARRIIHTIDDRLTNHS